MSTTAAVSISFAGVTLSDTIQVLDPAQAPALDQPAVITGTAEQGQPLTVSTPATWTGEAVASVAYRWQRNSGAGWEIITGAAAASYTQTVADVGATVRAQVQATGTNGLKSPWHESNAMGPVAAGNVAPSVTVSGPASVTEGTQATLTATASDPDGTIASYAWAQTAGPAATVISGAGTATLVVQAPLVDGTTPMTWRCTVTDNAGATAQASRSLSILDSGGAVDSMRLGMNIGSVTAYTGGWLFANVLWHSQYPEQVMGTGAWTSDQGLITATVQTDRFRFKFADFRDKLPSGTYTVLNPSGANIAVGNFGTGPADASFSTAASFTFDIDGSTSAAICLYVKGSLSNTSGNVAIIMPGHLTSWNAGNVWYDQFLAYHAGMGSEVLRMMDLQQANGTLEQDWSDRVQVNRPILHKWCITGQSVPYELLIDLCNRVGASPWVQVPTRANDDYVQQMAALFDALLDPSLRPRVSYSNEPWNFAQPWIKAAWWVTHLTYTKYLPTVDAVNQRLTLAGHGLTTGQAVRCWQTRNTAIALKGKDADWRLEMGTNLYAKVLTSNTFELYGDAGTTTTKIPLLSGMVDLLMVNQGEAGKTPDLNTNYASRLLTIWDAFDAALGSANYERVMECQSSNVNHAVQRLAVPGMSARVSQVTPGPYYEGLWWFGRLVAASGQITPQVWVSGSETVHVAVYAAGATPSIADVVAGTGAIAHQAYAYTYLKNAWASLTPVAGLTNGTAYAVHYVLEDGGVLYRMQANITPSVEGSSLLVADSYAQQTQRGIVHQATTIRSRMVAHAALVPAQAILSAYEHGCHNYENPPTEADYWFNAYQQSAEYGQAMRAQLTMLAEVGMKEACWYADVMGTVFSIGESYTDTADVRYTTLASYAGQVPKLAPLSIGATYAGVVASEPGAYPYTAYTIGGSGITFTVLAGDPAGNFDFSGHAMRMVNDNGVNWSNPTGRELLVLARKGDQAEVFVLTLSLGSAWYAADAQLVWDAVADTDPASITLQRGGVATVPLTVGTGAAISGGLWEMSGQRYFQSGNALAGAIDLANPLLVSTVIDFDDLPSASRVLLKIGPGATYVKLEVAGSTVPRWAYYTDSVTTPQLLASRPTGKHAVWAWISGGQMLVGVDQTPGSSVAVATAGKTMSASTSQIDIGNSAGNDLCKHGSVMVLSRAGMTQAQALAYVAQMQARHGVA